MDLRGEEGIVRDVERGGERERLEDALLARRLRLALAARDTAPKVEDDVLLGDLVPHAVDRHLVDVLLQLRLGARHDDNVAVVRVVRAVDVDELRLLGLALARDDDVRVERAHPLARRRRHARHGRVEAVEVPVLVAKVARDDAPSLLRVGGAVAVVADDGPPVLVLEPEAVAVLLPDGATPARKRDVSLVLREAGQREREEGRT